jgi:hypothetical protein
VTLRDLHLGHMGCLRSCSEIDLITEKRLRHLPHTYSYVGMLLTPQRHLPTYRVNKKTIRPTPHGVKRIEATPLAYCCESSHVNGVP